MPLSHTIHGAGGPCGAEIINPHGVAGGDVHSHHEEAPAPSDKLERQEVRGEDAHGLHLEPLMILLLEESAPSLPWTHRLRCNHTVTQNEFRVAVAGYFRLGDDTTTNSHLAQASC